MKRAVLVCGCIAACAPPAVTPHVREVALPAAFDGGAPGASIAAIDWKTFFGDPNLVALVGEALATNQDLQIAVQRIAIARASVLRATGARLPEVALVAEAGLHRFARYTADGAGNASTDITPGRRVPTNLPNFAVGFEASWEADLWGRLAHLEDAARARYLASVEGTNLVVTNLVADVAAAYVELVALDREREIVTAQLARQTQAVELMRLEKQAGQTNELAVRQFEAQAASTRALAATTLQRTREIEGRLHLLVGSLPHAIARTSDYLAHDVPPGLATGVPSELLRNRADIRQAEAEVRAARLDVSAARAAFYPRLSISAGAGYEAFHPKYLLSTPESLAYSVVGGLIAPLVNRRGIAADFQTANALQLEAMYRYQGVVVRGFVEVATELAVLRQTEDIVEQRKAALAALGDAIDAADALFRAGKATYVEVLLAQQDTLAAELELVAALRDRHLAALRLYKALGGGWRGTLVAR